jgi:tetratricopeptide (TPR) repeat protein
MAGNREAFQRNLEQGHSAAWAGKWQAAIEHYTRAVAELPDEPEGHMNLGLALLNEGQLEKALKVYRRAAQLAPQEAEPLECVADVLERIGQLKEAAQHYIQASDIHVAQKDIERAIANWERATQLTPGLVKVHAQLAQAYERIGDRPKALREYLTLAYNFKRLDDTEKAIRAVERALRIDGKNALALNTLRALQTGGDVILPDDVIHRKRTQRQDSTPQGEVSDLFWSPETDTNAIGEAHPLGPIGEALNDALAILAEYVVEGNLNQAVAFALQGMEQQRQERYPEAVQAYQEALRNGMNHPSLKMNLGGLLLLTDQPKEAIAHLGEAINHPNLTAGALHGLGLAHHKLDEQAKATRYLVQSLQAVDTALANAQEVAELQGVYENILAALEGRTKETLKAVNERFIGLLSGKDWMQRVAETRRHMSETIIGEGSSGIVDFLVAKGGDELAESVARIDRYIRQGLYTLAIDEAHLAIERSPFYLPVHVRMAEVMMKEGRIRQAINKYNIIARAYMMRDENDRAASILGEVLEMAPLDVEVRVSLIELLESEERHSEAINQYIDLANTYQQLGDFERSSQTFGAAERLARRIDAPASKLAEIKHYVAEIHQMRLNTRQAQKLYEEILELVPTDEKALRALVDIFYNQGNQVEAIKRLDALLGLYAQKGMINRITSMLEELVRSFPQDAALRSRLASIYRKLGDKKRAIEQLDALGEIQLDAGLTHEAANTIKQIIAMNPDRIEEYRKLLLQLNG